MIREMTAADAREVAELHHAELTGLLRDLGPRAIDAYYRGAVASGSVIALVDRDGARLRGFVSGSVHPKRVRGAALRAHPFSTLSGLTLGLLRRPAALGALVRSFRGPDEGSYDPHVPELTYIATAPEHRGSGLGRRLVAAFEAALAARGAHAYELSVDVGNAGAIGFYEGLGFVAAGRYREFGTEHVRYRRQVASRGDA